MEIKCKKGSTIAIRKVVHKDSKCCAGITKQILKVLCYGKKACVFDVTLNTFGGHCMDQVGEVSIKYKCEKKKNSKKMVNVCPAFAY